MSRNEIAQGNEEVEQTNLENTSLHAPVVEIHDLSSIEESNKLEVANQIGNDCGRQSADGDAEDSEDENEQWESESLYEEALASLQDDQLYDQNSDDICTLAEAREFRLKLRAVGPEQFIVSTLGAGIISAKKLCTAFGIKPPLFLEDASDEAYHSLLGLGISRELSKRLKLPQYNTVDDAAKLIKQAKNIVVITGAGISTSLGIPDFRSKESGLYTKLESQGISDPQEVFDIELFREDPSVFYAIAKDILPSGTRFSPTHAFIKLLQDEKKLLTNYSQNIDNLEAKAGILPEKLVQCHGSFATATCVKCQHKVEGSIIYGDLKAGRVARCAQCMKTLLENKRQGIKRKQPFGESKRKSAKARSGKAFDAEEDSSEGEFDIPEAGVMKPDITFFGEALSDAFGDRLVDNDKEKVDLVIVIGTSLNVAPVSQVTNYLPSTVPQIYISRTPVSHTEFDIDLLGDCDIVVAELCRRAGLKLEHEMIPKDQQVTADLVSGYKSRFRISQKQS